MRRASRRVRGMGPRGASWSKLAAGSTVGEPRGNGGTSEQDGGRQQRDRRAALDILVPPER